MMSAKIELDWTNEELNIFFGSNIEIATEDDTENVMMSMEQLEKIFNRYRENTDEKTVEALENENINLKNENEELKSKLQQYEEYQDHLREQYYESGPF